MRTPTSSSQAPLGYTGIQIALHWAIALLILSQFLTGDWMGEFFRALIRSTANPDAARPEMGNAVWHFVGGATVLGLGLVRLIVRAMRGVPPDSPASPSWDRKLAHLTHYALYAAFFALPITGLAAYLLPSRDFGEVHEVLTTVLLVLIGLHVLGALYHQLILKDRLIRRVMVPVSPERHVPPARPN
ncbi:cytochrome b [Paracoccus contaminans]|uniref:Cytochrome b561 bacterial/Ni-hydrogenase domain-containing protein n=1 Tax=Paracoccus contaminans TaxID=1945662 RepID=A0A1W6CXP1_9RHOB|nr:cytochrome b [Paracoccus contaminans]ARJ69624.1 hypothetical protein B0A89_08300 [Paracoccus contaminans]